MCLAYGNSMKSKEIKTPILTSTLLYRTLNIAMCMCICDSTCTVQLLTLKRRKPSLATVVAVVAKLPVLRYA